MKHARFLFVRKTDSDLLNVFIFEGQQQNLKPEYALAGYQCDPLKVSLMNAAHALSAGILDKTGAYVTPELIHALMYRSITTSKDLKNHPLMNKWKVLRSSADMNTKGRAGTAIISRVR